MSKYIEKLEVVDAVQVSFPTKDAKGKPFKYVSGKDDKGKAVETTVAIHEDNQGLHVAINGRRANANDYLVTHADGEVEVVAKARFEAEYEAAK